MTEIIAGKYQTNESSTVSMGGTEQMALRMVKYLDPKLLEPFQIIHSRVRELRPDLRKILVCHDLAQDPEVANLADPEYRKQFDKIVFVSNWQAQMYHLTLGIPYSEFVVIPNAIEPFTTAPNKDYGGPIRLIYHTTPHRGLALLVPVFEQLSKHYDVELDVFSSFGVYGWEQRDQPYTALFDRLKALPNARYHGFKSNRQVRNTLTETHIFAYPSIWPETSCLAAIEAMCAGNIVVHPNFGALPETCGHMSRMYQYNEDPQKHANEFYKQLEFTVQAIKKQGDPVAQTMWQLYNNFYQWAAVEPQWIQLLKGLSDGQISR